MKENGYTELICKGFCKFYKKDKEEIHCGGYELLRTQLTIHELKLLSKFMLGQCSPDASGNKLAEFICEKCSFKLDGCDFREGLDSPPCGGYIIISRLKSALPLSNL